MHMSQLPNLVKKVPSLTSTSENANAPYILCSENMSKSLKLVRVCSSRSSKSRIQKNPIDSRSVQWRPSKRPNSRKSKFRFASKRARAGGTCYWIFYSSVVTQQLQNRKEIIEHVRGLLESFLFSVFHSSFMSNRFPPCPSLPCALQGFLGLCTALRDDVIRGLGREKLAGLGCGHARVAIAAPSAEGPVVGPHAGWSSCFGGYVRRPPLPSTHQPSKKLQRPL